MEMCRSIAALAHSIPGARVELECRGGQRVTVDRGAPAELDPCVLRSALLSPAGAELAWAILEARVGGTVADRGCGLYATDRAPHGQLRWFTSLLGPESIERLLAECPLEPPEPADLEVGLRPDRELGVTLVRVEATGLPDGLIDEVARWAQARCLAAEAESQVARITPDRRRG